MLILMLPPILEYNRCSYSIEGFGYTFPVTIAEGKHPFPYRTRQLSPLAPMVLLARVSGRVGRCRETEKKPFPYGKGFFFDSPPTGRSPCGPAVLQSDVDCQVKLTHVFR